MSFNHEDPIQLLQLRVGALEYLVRQLAATQPPELLKVIEENTLKQMDKWKDESPEIVEIMESALSLMPNN